MSSNFRITRLQTFRPAGTDYELTVNDDALVFKCLTVGGDGRAPSASERSQLDFAIDWSNVSDVQNPAMTLDRVLQVIESSGDKIICTFVNGEMRNHAYAKMKGVLAKLPPKGAAESGWKRWNEIIGPLAFSIAMLVMGLGLMLYIWTWENTAGSWTRDPLSRFLSEAIGKFRILAFSVVFAICGLLVCFQRIRARRRVSDGAMPAKSVVIPFLPNYQDQRLYLLIFGCLFVALHGAALTNLAIWQDPSTLRPAANLRHTHGIRTQSDWRNARNKLQTQINNLQVMTFVTDVSALIVGVVFILCSLRVETISLAGSIVILIAVIGTITCSLFGSWLYWIGVLLVKLPASYLGYRFVSAKLDQEAAHLREPALLTSYPTL